MSFLLLLDPFYTFLTGNRSSLPDYIGVEDGNNLRIPGDLRRFIDIPVKKVSLTGLYPRVSQDLDIPDIPELIMLIPASGHLSELPRNINIPRPRAAGNHTFCSETPFSSPSTLPDSCN